MELVLIFLVFLGQGNNGIQRNELQSFGMRQEHGHYLRHTQTLGNVTLLRFNLPAERPESERCLLTNLQCPLA